MVRNGESQKSYNIRRSLPALPRRQAGGRQGLGMYEMLKMAMYRPWAFSLMIVLIKCHMYGLVRKMLGVQ